MVANFKNRTEVERFFRDASANELLAERGHLQDLMASFAPAVPEPLLNHFAVRIAYELRFRIPQPV